MYAKILSLVLGGVLALSGLTFHSTHEVKNQVLELQQLGARVSVLNADDIRSDVLPDGNNTRDIGAFGSAWNDVFASGTAYLGAATVGDGSTNGVVSSNEATSLQLSTGSGTGGQLIVPPNANGNLEYRPNGTGGMVLSGTDSGGTGPFYTSHHDSASPAMSDAIGGLVGTGNNSVAASGTIQYANMFFGITDPTAGQETANVGFQINQNGAGVGTALYISPNGAGDRLVYILGDPQGLTGFATTSIRNASGRELVLDPTWLRFQTNNELTFESTGTEEQGPLFDLYHNSVSPAEDDESSINFMFNDSLGTKQAYAAVIGGISDETAGGIEGFLDLLVADKNGNESGVGIGADGGDKEVTLEPITDSEDSSLNIVAGGSGGHVSIGGGQTSSTVKFPRRFGGSELFNSSFGSEGGHSAMGVITLDHTDFLSKLDGSTNNLFLDSLPAKFIITDVTMVTTNAAGSAATIDVGTSASGWALHGNDQNAFVAAVDANTGGAEERTTVDANAAENGVATNGSANITITSSADISASSYQGLLFIQYATYE